MPDAKRLGREAKLLRQNTGTPSILGLLGSGGETTLYAGQRSKLRERRGYAVELHRDVSARHLEGSLVGFHSWAPRCNLSRIGRAQI